MRRNTSGASAIQSYTYGEDQDRTVVSNLYNMNTISSRILDDETYDRSPSAIVEASATNDQGSTHGHIPLRVKEQAPNNLSLQERRRSKGGAAIPSIDMQKLNMDSRSQSSISN